MHVCNCLELAYLSLNHMTYVAFWLKAMYLTIFSSYELRMKVIYHMHVQFMNDRSELVSI